MPEFSACYFCGTALDEPLAEYPVVPDALHPSPDQQGTVVLCPSCRRKLGAVVDTVIGAVDDSPADDSIQRELTEPSADGALPSADGENVGVGVAGDGADREFEFQAVDDSDDTGSEPEDTVETNTTDPLDEGSVDDASVTNAGESETDTGTDDGGSDTVNGESVDATGQETAEQGATGGNSARGEASNETPSDEASKDEPQMTALEYTKVMRLLQNREFPIDHEEFKVVATNAYEISEDEFDAVIEAATERGLIDVDGSRIVDA